MTLRTFLKLVEIQTKLASLFPFLVGLLFVIYRYDTFNLINTLIFFCSMLIFDLTTTAINNYMDYKKATTDDYRKRENIIGQENIPLRLVRFTIISMLIIAAALGVLLVFRTDLLVLFLGIICFFIGVFYTYGPIPLSRLPLGEIFSGLTMGFGILFLTVYINAFDQGIAELMIEGRNLILHVDLILISEIIWVSFPCVFTIANIMLSNNLCDLEDDIKNNRFTLPYYLGKKHSIWLYNALYIASFIAILTAVIFNILPMVMLLCMVIILPVYKHMNQFSQKQIKSETFVLSLKNLILVNGSIVAMMLVSLIV